jgi:uncharacterized protein involved in outer membrane biogenesis
MPEDRQITGGSARSLLAAISSRLRRVLTWSIGILLAFAVLGFFVAPRVLRPYLEDQLSQTLERKVSIERL